VQGQGLHKLLYAGVERGYWKKSFADKQNFKSDPIIVTPYTAYADLGEVSKWVQIRLVASRRKRGLGNEFRKCTYLRD
jgi:hypothetical protein